MKYLISITFLSVALFGHNLVSHIQNREAVVVSLSFIDSKSDFSYKPYEVYYEKEKIPFSVGRTDKLSRVVFIPNARGAWIVKAMSEDGHGKSITVSINDSFAIEKYSKPIYEKYIKIFVGISLIFILFQIFKFIKRGKNEENS